MPSRKARRQRRYKERYNRRQAAAIRRAIRPLLNGLFEEVSRGIAKADKPIDLFTEADFSTFQAEYSRQLRRVMRGVYLANIQPTNSAVSLDFPGPGFKVELSTDTQDRLTAEYIREIQPKLAGESQDLANNLRDFIAEQVEGGIETSKFESLLAEKFSQISSGRAANFAKNLAFESYSKSRTDFWKEAPPESQPRGKEWYPSFGGENDRQWHNDIPAANGIVPFDDFFIITGGPDGTQSALYPNDPNLPASEARNCGCDYGFAFREPR